MANIINGKDLKKPTLLGYELNPKQDVIVNYLIPSICGCCLYILHFASDFTVAWRHFQEEHYLWGSLTVLFMYLPVLGCFLITISLYELWPVSESSKTKLKWLSVKILQHLFFPVWSMWRYAEKMFWSIEAMRAPNEQESKITLKNLSQSRTIELYFFLRAYLQSAPQILLQLHILIRFFTEMEIQTVKVQVLSIAMSLSKMAVTTTYYQRFKSQKIGGKLYPWYKPYKFQYDQSIDPVKNNDNESVALRHTEIRKEHRRSSGDFYEVPSPVVPEEPQPLARETSILDGPNRILLRETDETDLFIPSRLSEIKALPEDDMAGKLISFMWWYCFLLARMLVISSFAYFYPSEIVWILSAHFILVISLLLYDIRAQEVRRAKAAFFIFIGFVYLFCLIEFKVRFKKTWFIYNGFFLLIFSENFAMCLTWWYRNVDEIVDDFWFKYIFYMIVGCSALSLVTMVFYFRVLKPHKVVVGVIPQNK